jgi:Family of unknown function (DUF5723)
MIVLRSALNRFSSPALLLAAVTLLGPDSATAAAKTSVRAAAMGGAFTAVAEGVQATRWNPANLAWSDPSEFGIELFSTAASVANNGIDLDLYNRTAGARLDDADKLAILSSIPSDGLATRLDAGASVLGFHYGQVALSFGGEASAYSRLPHDVFQLVLMGNAVADSLDFSQAEGEAISYASARLSAASSLGETPFGRMNVGLTISYLEGLAYGRLEKMEGSLVTRPTGIMGRAEALLTTAGRGQGLGLDLGVATEWNSNWRGGATLENVYGRIEFNSNLEERTFLASTDTLDIVTVQEVESPDSLYTSTNQVKKIDSFSVDLPRVLRVGIARHGERSVLALEYEQGFSTRAGASSTPAAAIGAEWRALNWLPLRFGVSGGGQRGSSASAGFGLRLASFRLDVAAATIGSLWPGNPRGVVLGIGTGLEF